MVVAPNAKNITLNSDVFPEISKSWLESKETYPHKTNRTFTGYINDLLTQILERNQYIKDTFPHLELIGYNKYNLSIKDNNEDMLIEIYRNIDNKLFCRACKSDNCNHVIYSYQLPESMYVKSKNT